MIEATTHSAEQAEVTDKTLFGFWVYLMTDVILFGCLFATYAVLHDGTYGGPTSNQLFDLSPILVETLILLTSSYTCGIAIIAMRRNNVTQTLFWLGLTLVLGITFLIMEMTEFGHLIAAGNGWERSGFLSAFFTLVGTHGLHIAIGLLWAGVLGWQVITRGLTNNVSRRLTLFSMFWHFLDVIWIFIFTIVYLMGVA